MKYLDLNDENRIPMMGIGTFLLTPDEAENSVYNALKDGYSLIDTANAYVNERAVGRGIRRAIEEGIKEGKEKGSTEEKINIAKKLIEKGLNIKEISEITELSINEIEKILKE